MGILFKVIHLRLGLRTNMKHMNKLSIQIKKLALCAITLSMLTACVAPMQHGQPMPQQTTAQASGYNTLTNTVVGAAIGAGIGQLTGKNTKSTLIGAAVGAGLGYQFGQNIRDSLFGLKQTAGVTVDVPPQNAPANAPVTIRIPEQVSFDSNSSQIRQDANTQATINKIVEVLRQQNYSVIIAIGHADASGDPARNVALSVDRATVFANELARRGLDGRRIRAEGHGAREPIAENTTPEGRAKNRRVELLVYPA
jgi:outer membrane protein OmpA-like peptidoglycan-associated protein